MPSYRLTLHGLCLLLILPGAWPALADQPAPAAEPEQRPLQARPSLPERSQEDAAALERQLPASEQQTLQAGDESFLALWKPANSNAPQGAVIIIPGAGETADWPQAIGPLRRKLPDVHWASLSLTLPDRQTDANQPRTTETENVPTAPEPNSSSKEASTTAKPIEQAASAEAESAEAETDAQPAETIEAMSKADAVRVFARIDAAIAFARQQNMRSLVLLGHGTGAYWAARYVSEKQPPHIQKLLMVAAQTPAHAQPDLSLLVPNLSVPVLDIFYTDKPLAREAALQRSQAVKRSSRSLFNQLGLMANTGNRDAEQEQLLRRVRGWLSPPPTEK